MKRRFVIIVTFVVFVGPSSRLVAQDDTAKALIHLSNGEKLKRGKSIKNLEKAIEEFTEAIRLDPKLTEAYAHRGSIWLQRGKQDKAIADLNVAIKLDPNHKMAHWQRATAWNELKIYGNAIADYTRVIDLKPKEFGLLEWSFVYSARGSAWMAKKDYEKALVDFNHAIFRDVRNPHGFFNRGNVWLAKRDYHKAFDDFNRAAKLDDRNPKYPSYRGLARFYKKEYDQAIADFDAAEKMATAGDWLPMHRAIMLATCADPKYRDGKKAVEQAMRALEEQGFIEPDTKYYIPLAAAHAEAGDFAEAVRYQEQVLADADYRNDKEMRERLVLFKNKQPYRQP